MNSLYAKENISHIHWQPDVYETQLTTGQPPHVLSLTRGGSLGRFVLAKWAFPLSSGAQLGGYIALPALYNLKQFYSEQRSKEITSTYKYFIAQPFEIIALSWFNYFYFSVQSCFRHIMVFYILCCGPTLDSIKILFGIFFFLPQSERKWHPYFSAKLI